MPNLLEKLNVPKKDRKRVERILNKMEDHHKKMIKKYGQDYFNNPEYQREVLIPGLAPKIPMKGGIKKITKIYIPGQGWIPFPGPRYGMA